MNLKVFIRIPKVIVPVSAYRINNGKQSYKNFLSKEISDSVADSLKEQKKSGFSSRITGLMTD